MSWNPLLYIPSKAEFRDLLDHTIGGPHPKPDPPDQDQTFWPTHILLFLFFQTQINQSNPFPLTLKLKDFQITPNLKTWCGPHYRSGHVSQLLLLLLTTDFASPRKISLRKKKLVKLLLPAITGDIVRINRGKLLRRKKNKSKNKMQNQWAVVSLTQARDSRLFLGLVLR